MTDNSDTISRYFFTPDGKIEIPPPGAIIGNVKITGIKRTAPPCTPLSAVDFHVRQWKRKQTKPKKKKQRTEFFFSHVPSPLPQDSMIVKSQENSDADEIRKDEVEDDDDDEEFEEITPRQTPIFEYEELEEEDIDDDDDADTVIQSIVPPVKEFIFVENRDEKQFVCSRIDKRPNEELLDKQFWQREDIYQLLKNKLAFTDEEIENIISLSKEIIKLVTMLSTAFKLLQTGILTRQNFVVENIFDFRTLVEKLDELYKVEKRPLKHLILFLVPGQKARFIASDLPCWMTMNQKRVAAHHLFCPPNQSIKRVLYWVKTTSDIREPLRVFGDQKPCDISSVEPDIKREDHITTVFMKRYWKLERLFSAPEFF